MKKSLVFGLAFMAFGFAGLAFAGPTLVRVRLPFAFHAGEALIPAGEYLIQLNSPNQSNIKVMSTDGSKSFFVPFQESSWSPKGECRVVFNRYGEAEYFLRAVEDGDVAVKMSITRKEREIASVNSKAVAIAGVTNK